MYQTHPIQLQNSPGPGPGPEINPDTDIPEMPDHEEIPTEPGPHIPEQVPPVDPRPAETPTEFPKLPSEQ